MPKQIRIEIGMKTKPMGVEPAVVLINPKYPHNVGAAVRAASCWGAKQVWYTGNRVVLAPGQRLPREERMKGYKDVELRQFDRPLECFKKGVEPVCVELVTGAMPLHEFEHPERAVYVFGPEDGHVPPTLKRLCHHMVVIPTRHCLNLAAAVNIVLYDRLYKRHHGGLEIIPLMDELLRNDRVEIREREERELRELVGATR